MRQCRTSRCDTCKIGTSAQQLDWNFCNQTKVIFGKTMSITHTDRWCAPSPAIQYLHPLCAMNAEWLMWTCTRLTNFQKWPSTPGPTCRQMYVKGHSKKAIETRLLQKPLPNFYLFPIWNSRKATTFTSLRQNQNTMKLFFFFFLLLQH